MDSAGVVQAGQVRRESTSNEALYTTMLDMMDQDLNKDQVSS